MSRQSIKPAGLPVIHDRAAGIDIGARFHVVGVAPELCDESVQTFQAFTGDIERMADWLVSIGIETVAMESTGVYWVPTAQSTTREHARTYRDRLIERSLSHGTVANRIGFLATLFRFGQGELLSR